MQGYYVFHLYIFWNKEFLTSDQYFPVITQYNIIVLFTENQFTFLIDQVIGLTRSGWFYIKMLIDGYRMHTIHKTSLYLLKKRFYLHVTVRLHIYLSLLRNICRSLTSLSRLEHPGISIPGAIKVSYLLSIYKLITHQSGTREYIPTITRLLTS